MGGLITLSTLLDTAPFPGSQPVSGVVLSGPLVKLSDKIGSCTRWIARRLAGISPTMGVEAIDVDKLSHDTQWGMVNLAHALC